MAGEPNKNGVPSRVVIITGASRGIGRATAIELAESGWRVVLVARNLDALNETASACRESLMVPGDVASPDTADRVVRLAIERFGRVDALVNNAGAAPLLPIEQTTDAIWHDTIETNLSGAFRMARACWSVFKRAGGGVIVNVSSLAARDPLPGFIAYGAAKAGLENLTLSLAREGAAINVRAHAVSPGATDTDMFRSIKEFASFPAEKRLDPREVARVIVKCVTGELQHTSGEVIHVHWGPR